MPVTCPDPSGSSRPATPRGVRPSLGPPSPSRGALAAAALRACGFRLLLLFLLRQPLLLGGVRTASNSASRLARRRVQLAFPGPGSGDNTSPGSCRATLSADRSARAWRSRGGPGGSDPGVRRGRCPCPWRPTHWRTGASTLSACFALVVCDFVVLLSWAPGGIPRSRGASRPRRWRKP